MLFALGRRAEHWVGRSGRAVVVLTLASLPALGLLAGELFATAGVSFRQPRDPTDAGVIHVAFVGPALLPVLLLGGTSGGVRIRDGKRTAAIAGILVLVPFLLGLTQSPEQGVIAALVGLALVPAILPFTFAAAGRSYWRIGVGMAILAAAVPVLLLSTLGTFLYIGAENLSHIEGKDGAGTAAAILARANIGSAAAFAVSGWCVWVGLALFFDGTRRPREAAALENRSAVIDELFARGLLEQDERREWRTVADDARVTHATLHAETGRLSAQQRQGLLMAVAGVIAGAATILIGLGGMGALVGCADSNPCWAEFGPSQETVLFFFLTVGYLLPFWLVTVAWGAFLLHSSVRSSAEIRQRIEILRQAAEERDEVILTLARSRALAREPRPHEGRAPQQGL